MPKISALPLAVLPLSGLEAVVMNQNGVTTTTALTAVQNYVLGNALISLNSIFIGNNAGQNVYTAYANFIGQDAGSGATNAGECNFIGHEAGKDAINANTCNFIGTGAGLSATNAENSNFFGWNAGYNGIDVVGSNFLGYQAGFGASGASDSNFIGNVAGINIVTGIKNICIGSNTGTNSTALSALSGCIVMGDSARATQSNTVVLGSTGTPLLTAATGTTTGSYLVVRINGRDLKIPLYQ